MISFFDFLQDLTNPSLSFLWKALVVAVASSIVCGVIGTHVVLRGMAFIGDAVAHAVFPGLAIAFYFQISLLVGGAMAGVAVAIAVTLFSQNRRLREDAIIGVFFAAAFAIGLIIISRVDGYTGSLQSFLFGSITGVPDSDVALVMVVGAVIVLLALFLNRRLVAVSLDRETASAAGINVLFMDMLLYLLVTFSVVISVRTIGNILVLALLITPAATARLLTDRLAVMMTLGPVIGGISAFFGIYLSWSFSIPTGAAIVVVISAVFILVWLLSPKHGFVTAQLKARRHHTHPVVEAA